MDLAGSKLDEVSVSQLDDDVGLALAAKHCLGWLASSNDALVLHVGIPHGGSKSAS